MNKTETDMTIIYSLSIILIHVLPRINDLIV